MRHLVAAMLILLAIIHLLPSVGALGGDQLNTLYGVTLTDPNLVILMRHRAVLFGLLGMFFLYAVFKTELRTSAFAIGFVSVSSFLWLTWSAGDYNAELARVFVVDIIALAFLVIGVTNHIYRQ